MPSLALSAMERGYRLDEVDGGKTFGTFVAVRCSRQWKTLSEHFLVPKAQKQAAQRQRAVCSCVEGGLILGMRLPATLVASPARCCMSAAAGVVRNWLLG